MQEKSAHIGEQVDYQGIPYYLEQMNEWVRDYAYHFNEIYGVENATDLNGNTHEGAIFFTGDNSVTGGQFYSMVRPSMTRALTAQKIQDITC